MQQKRPASVPIFNRGKRPRQALLSHPNNNVYGGAGGAGGGLQQRHRDQPEVAWNSQFSRGQNKPPSQPASYYFEGSYNRPQAQNSSFTQKQTSRESYNHFQTHHNKENIQSPTPQRTWSNNSSHSFHHTGQQGSSHYNKHTNNPQTTMTTNKPPSRFTPYVLSNKEPQGSGTRPGQTGSHRGVFEAERTFEALLPGRAVEPTLQHSAKIEPVVVQVKQSHLPRVLTATARGVSHWSRFKSHVPMLFEVLGVLNSAVVSGPLGSREFNLRAVDGTLRCLYWEIDTTLPHMTRGKPVRVVGGWDEKQEWLKCHSVREAKDEEVKTAPDLVTLSDTSMKLSMAMMHEI